MGRKLNVSGPSGQDCEWDLNTIQVKDIQEREKARLRKIEHELTEAANRKSFLDQEKEFSEKNCALCSSAFNFLFNKKIRCQECHCNVCRNCTHWNGKDKLWLCRACERNRALYVHPGDVLSKHLSEKFKGYDGSKIIYSIWKRDGKWIEEDEEVLQEDASLVIEVWTHVETLLEGLLGQTLDNAAINSLPHYPHYSKILMKHEELLAAAILKLAKALGYSLQNISPSEDLTPTTAHVHLKSILLDLQNAISNLPLLEEGVSSSAAGQIESSQSISAKRSRDSHLYEDILMTAVFNKLLEEKTRSNTQTLDGSECTSTEEDSMVNKKERSGSSISSGTTSVSGREYPDIVAHLDNAGTESDSTCATNTFRERESSLGEESATDEFTWSKEGQTSLPPVEYVIEEQVEEITTTEAYTDSDEDISKGRTSRYSSHQSVKRAPEIEVKSCDVIPGLHYVDVPNMTEILRVPFPELGVDMINTSLLDDEGDSLNGFEDDVSVRFMGVLSWEDNWLFKRKRISPALANSLMRRTGFFDEPICMLIPNPTEFVYPLIGSREIDEVSELSERNSVGSLDLQSDIESEADVLPPRTESPFLPVKQSVNADLPNSPNIKPEVRSSVRSKTPPQEPRIQTKCSNVSNYVNLIQPPILQVPNFLPTTSRQIAGRDPSFTVCPEGVTVHSGKAARFTCEVSGTKPIGVAWFKDGKIIENGDKYQISLVCHKYMLEIYETSKTDVGTYTCVVYNGKGQQWTDCKLQVKASSRACNPPEFVVPLRVIQSDAGQVRRLTCTVSGYPEPRVHIYHNQQPLISGDQCVIEPTGYGEIVVEILSSKPKIDGQYYAIASNKLGDASCSCFIGNSDQRSNNGKNDVNANHHNSTILMPENTPKKLTWSKPKLIQRTWSERQAELQRTLANAFNEEKVFAESSLENTYMVRDEPDGSGSPDEEELTEAINWNPVALNGPPRPGTIAEREHNKWQNAVPWPNNPYSPENIARRKNKSSADIVLVDQPLTFDEFMKQTKEEVMDEEQLALLASHAKSRDLARYKRDYYVNYSPGKDNPVASSKGKMQQRNGLSEKDTVDEALNSLEEKVYSANKTVHSKSLKVAESDSAKGEQTESQSFATRVMDSDREMSVVELEVARIRPSLDKLTTLSRESAELSQSVSEDDMSLPSVKELASKFIPLKSGSEENVSNSKADKPLIAAVNRKKAIVVENDASSSSCQSLPEKKAPEPMPRSSVKVHSLTARSLSREFRESAQRNLPRPMNRPLPVAQESREQSLTSLTSGETSLTSFSHESRGSSPSLPLSPFAGSAFTEGYTSDESTTSNNSLPRNKTRKRISRSVLQRASYWEKRAEQGLLSDTSVNEDFPPMESIPK